MAARKQATAQKIATLAQPIAERICLVMIGTSQKYLDGTQTYKMDLVHVVRCRASDNATTVNLCKYSRRYATSRAIETHSLGDMFKHKASN